MRRHLTLKEPGHIHLAGQFHLARFHRHLLFRLSGIHLRANGIVNDDTL